MLDVELTHGAGGFDSMLELEDASVFFGMNRMPSQMCGRSWIQTDPQIHFPTREQLSQASTVPSMEVGGPSAGEMVLHLRRAFLPPPFPVGLVVGLVGVHLQHHRHQLAWN